MSRAFLRHLSGIERHVPFGRHAPEWVNLSSPASAREVYEGRRQLPCKMAVFPFRGSRPSSQLEEREMADTFTARGPRGAVLLVDDEPHILEGLQLTLRAEPYE